MAFWWAVGISARAACGATRPFVDVQFDPRVHAQTTHAVERSQEFKCRLEGG